VTQNRIDPLDTLDSAGVVERLLDAEERVVPAVRAARPQIGAAADLIARQVRCGGRIAFVGAGTSGRLALCEAAGWVTLGKPGDANAFRAGQQAA